MGTKRRFRGVILGLIIGIISLIALMVSLSLLSRMMGNYGLDKGKLKDCSGKPNCICTEGTKGISYPPLAIGELPQGQAWAELKAIIQEAGGKIVFEKGKYLRATFSTGIFQFIDDFEARLEPSQNSIHLRSSSRIGYYDFGANKKRMDKISQRFNKNHLEN